VYKVTQTTPTQLQCGGGYTIPPSPPPATATTLYPTPPTRPLPPASTSLRLVIVLGRTPNDKYLLTVVALLPVTVQPKSQCRLHRPTRSSSFAVYAASSSNSVTAARCTPSSYPSRVGRWPRRRRRRRRRRWEHRSRTLTTPPPARPPSTCPDTTCLSIASSTSGPPSSRRPRRCGRGGCS